ncbi:signal transduction histidine kinase/phage shock protein PspC (stress-responsive transcriptional regulator) [Arthrobacter sp. PvP102]|uniref:ATP-binding protein n=1 Tax=unclassified Arthrobacter TaxID=235627 RepID=UPI000052724A|nr:MULTISPECIES: ATP-binding protein [unclassified Arthrobacter]ABK04378.1 putative signal transduction histidine kinase [Arthrobacter sp. FB24]MBP1232315.1 signal transduction histidine kinase/phage shock protein PspC (stress-responsive transcriptional regulator) [Arthrobacter sp. PvP103]MBP1237450.1 signal transduction histidine kinase/phage shock protein PspC (stress-responsive transcriptional regulator) [Arthrobacter sp. PvP102]
MTTAFTRPPLVRSSDRVIAGVCAGLAAHLGWPVRMVRIGMAVAALAGGAGLAFYAWLWIMVPTADENAKRTARRPTSPIAPAVSAPGQLPVPMDFVAAPMPGVAAFPGTATLPGAPDQGLASGSGQGASGGTTAGTSRGPAGGTAATAPWFRMRSMPYGKEVLLGAGLLLAGGILIARMLGVDVPLGTLIPAAAILGGAAIAWIQLDETRRAGLLDKTKADQAGGWARLAAGLALVVAGVLVMVSGSGSWEQTWLALLASVAVLGGVALVLLPWGLKFWRDLEAERAGRVRATERAEIAAHLHDSVLQTLALIQRRAGNEHDVLRLARAQERELRGWLYRDPGKEAGQLSERIRAAAAEVEDTLGHAVDVVTVGDTAMTPRHEALVQASREAMVNASRHGGGAVSVYLEVADGGAEVYVKDRGPGFDPQSVPEDRMGVRESIVGRMNRHGGTAVISSSSDGTEVRLRLPSDAADNGEGKS